MATTVSADHVSGVRSFNRFYTRRIGVLERTLLGSPFTLTEGRVLYEIANRDAPAAGEIGRDLGLDAGYLSRILSSFERKKLIARTRSKDDARRAHLTLTASGRSAFARINQRSLDEVTEMLAPLSADNRRVLASSMLSITQLLGGASTPERIGGPDLQVRPTPGLKARGSTQEKTRGASAAAVTLRAHRPGDMGWVVHRHAALYHQEYGWDGTFEAMVARITADFVDHFNPKRERCWIAEIDGRFAGCVFVVEKSKTVAQLRMLLVEPSARGHGIGNRLVEACLDFAGKAGYRRMMLWTNDILTSARRIYEAHGFALTSQNTHKSFGKTLVGQTWERRL